MAEPGSLNYGITVEPLTHRERELLQLLAQGLNDREIAERLYLSINTVKWHARRIYEKLGVGSRRQAVTKAWELGLLAGKALKPARRHNLPRTLTKLVGRKVEIPQVVELVWKHNLVTLTGSGGVGKTRLALAAAHELLDDFQDGVTYIDLSAVTNPGMVMQSAMAALGIMPDKSMDPVENLVFHLNDREVLLVLNNCEHLAAACAAMIRALLSQLDRLKALATSREPLRVEGEALYRVPSLTYPATGLALTADELADYDSIALFVERAQDVLPGFQLDESNCAAVARICRRLDGIPLAIELAASRCASLGAIQVADRLEHSFHLLTGGTRTALERHRTLRSTIEWSYQLISEPERRLLRRLGVFVGGWILQAAEQVCAGEGIAAEDVADLLCQLVDKSLVQADRLAEHEPRYSMLATIQQFALEELYRSGESERLRRRHFEWVARSAAQAGPELMTGKRLGWIKRLMPEQRNIYAAMAWAIEEENDLPGGLETLFRLQGFHQTFASRLDFQPMLRKASEALDSWENPPARLQTLNFFLLTFLRKPGNIDQEYIVFLRQALAASENLSLEDRWMRALVFCFLGWLTANIEGKIEQGYLLLLEAEKILRPMAEEHPWHLGWALEFKAWVLRWLGKHAEAEASCQEGAQLILKTGDVWSGQNWGIYWELAESAYRSGNYELAKTYYEIEKAHCLEVDNEFMISSINRIKANWERERGNYGEAWQLYQSTLQIVDQMEMITSVCVDLNGMAANLSSLAETQASINAQQTWMNAVRILAALVKAHEEYHTGTFFEDRIICDKALASAKNGLAPLDFEKAWAEGLAMHYKQMVAFAKQIQMG